MHIVYLPLNKHFCFLSSTSNFFPLSCSFIHIPNHNEISLFCVPIKNLIPNCISKPSRFSCLLFRGKVEQFQSKNIFIGLTPNRLACFIVMEDKSYIKMLQLYHHLLIAVALAMIWCCKLSVSVGQNVINCYTSASLG